MSQTGAPGSAGQEVFPVFSVFLGSSFLTGVQFGLPSMNHTLGNWEQIPGAGVWSGERSRMGFDPREEEGLSTQQEFGENLEQERKNFREFSSLDASQTSSNPRRPRGILGAERSLSERSRISRFREHLQVFQRENFLGEFFVSFRIVSSAEPGWYLSLFSRMDKVMEELSLREFPWDFGNSGQAGWEEREFSPNGLGQVLSEAAPEFLLGIKVDWESGFSFPCPEPKNQNVPQTRTFLPKKKSGEKRKRGIRVLHSLNHFWGNSKILGVFCLFFFPSWETGSKKRELLELPVAERTFPGISAPGRI